VFTKTNWEIDAEDESFQIPDKNMLDKQARGDVVNDGDRQGRAGS
jgi:hypothetical protein